MAYGDAAAKRAVGRPHGSWHPDKVRARIKVSQLLNRLNDHAHNRIDPPMSPSQVKAACFLVERVIPRAELPNGALEKLGQLTLESLLAGAIAQRNQSVIAEQPASAEQNVPRGTLGQEPALLPSPDHPEEP